VAQVVLVALVGVGFLLEADGAVGTVVIARDTEADEILQAIPEVEQQEQHLQLLSPVDALVTVGVVGVPCVLAHKDEGPDGDGAVAREGYEVVSDDDHCRFAVSVLRYCVILAFRYFDFHG